MAEGKRLELLLKHSKCLVLPITPTLYKYEPSKMNIIIDRPSPYHHYLQAYSAIWKTSLSI